MKSVRYIISPEANEDLRNILEYGLDSYLPDKAFGYYDGLIETFKLLVKYPFMGEVSEHDNTVRKFSYQKTSLIIYEIKSNHIRILRVFGSRQNIPERF